MQRQYPLLPLDFLYTNEDVCNQPIHVGYPTGGNTVPFKYVVSHTGIFSAAAVFSQPVNVSWMNGSVEVPLGYMSLSILYASNKRATINDTTTLLHRGSKRLRPLHELNDYFTKFYLEITEFQSECPGDEVPHPRMILVQLTRSLVKARMILTAMSFSRTCNYPATILGGGIDFVAVTQLNNTSPFALELGTVVFDLASTKMFILVLERGSIPILSINLLQVPGRNNITLNGILLFTNHINFESSPVIAVGKSTLQPDGFGKPSVHGLPFKSTTPINPNSVYPDREHGACIHFRDDMDPANGHNHLAAQRLGATNVFKSLCRARQTPEGTINITILNSVLNAADPEHDSTTTDFLLVGNSRAVTNTSIGQITLDPIKVNGSTSLNGLQGPKGYTTIGAVDLMGGTQQALNFSIDELQLQRGGAIFGTALMPNLTMSMGNNSPNNSPEGLQTLSQFVGGQVGVHRSLSLLEAFESMNITATLPGLNSSLLSTGFFGDQVAVALVNPFAAGFDITSISSNVMSHGLYLGSINTATNFKSAGKSTAKSPVLDMTMNYDPPTLFTLTRRACRAGSSWGLSGFNLPNFVDQVFKQLRSDIQLSSQLTIGSTVAGNYATTLVLSYTQTDVPISADSSLNLILLILAKPIVQKVLNYVLTKLWKGPIGPLVMPNNESFESVISGDNLTGTFMLGTTALSLTSIWRIHSALGVPQGIEVSGISLPSKAVALKGFRVNGLKNGVVIDSFDLPFNDPAGGIHLTINSEVINPSRVGIELSSLAFNTYSNGIEIAPVSSTSTVTLAPNYTSSLGSAGRLIPQNSLEGFATVSAIFNNYIHGMDSQVTVYGAGAGPSDLNEGIQTIRVVTSLPNKGKLNIIQSIDLEQSSLMFTEATAYDPMSGSNLTTAAFRFPSRYHGACAEYYCWASFAELVIPRGPSTTDVQNRIIYLTFNDDPFAVYSDQHETFQNFIAATTLGSSQGLALSGTANADASTAVGMLSLVDIEFSVQSTITGLQGLKVKPASVANLDVNYGYSDYLLITVDASLFNPRNQVIGSADLYPLDVHRSPQGAAQTAAAMLGNHLQGVDSQTTIMGTSSSTSIGSLEPALAQINLSPVTIPALHQNLIGSASLGFPTDIVQTGVASTTFTLANPFTASINLLEVTAIATYHNLTLGAINHVDMSSNPIHANGHSNITSLVLPFNFNLDPLTIIGLITTSAQERNVDLGPLTRLFRLVIDNPSFHPPVR
ncbi:hypothetical protein DFJ58DRAFT_845939 [Suillus subalutaceus]|uniref:uncharacterized protein n=1 Tax=Suillus subalutaceus TaxID=48586 RepID=UPI001B86A767|nr:uncharacterized protein DFJ58DRAFT_845939 [Suillus subalutaceus]KAG1838827.1 hypothetical protein DFJ58DRAFT_845939 [Suillus subalutaceus]